MTVTIDLAGRSALVTGSSRGIGRAIALKLAAAGADVAVHCAGRVDEAERVAESIRERGRRACAVAADLADEDAVRRIGGAVTPALGTIDILVVNAAIHVRKPWHEMLASDVDLQTAVNLRASLALIQRFAPAMIARRWGRILVIGSVQQARPHPDMVVYAATKDALHSMVRNLARQFAPSGVTVNMVAPGVIETDRNAEALRDPEYRARVLARIPAGAFGTPEECADIALVFCTDISRYITGANLFVDGGMHVG